MTNVQTSCRHSYLWVLQAICLLVFLGAFVPGARAQGLFSQPGSQSSAGASEVLDVNRRAFGVNVRGGHVTGNSVGRIDPVTHLNISPYFNVGPTAFIADFQLGRANEGGLTGHMGGVFRTFVEEWDVVTGVSMHHNRDEITGTLFKTWGVGVDVLTDTWEARANWVRPNGKRQSIVNQRIDQTTAAFAGNNIVFNRIDTVAEALEGVDMEVGRVLFEGWDDSVRVRGFVGAYRYFSDSIPEFTGWKTHLRADVLDRLELDLTLTEDTQFQTTVSFGAVVHLGGFKAQDYTRGSAIHRLADPVRRNLTVPTVQTNVVVGGVAAVNPADGLAYQVVHVDENDTVGPFVGTVEAPLMSLTTGLGVPDTDLVFVHAGGVYNAGPDNEITVGVNQRVFGEGLIPVVTDDRNVVSTIPVLGLGDLVVPSSPTFLASEAAGTPLARPTLQGAVGNSVTLQNGSQFGGFVVSGAGGAGIFSDNVENTRVHDTLVENTTGAGILLQNTIGTTDILNTIISGTTGPAFHVMGGNGSIAYRSSSTGLDPSFANILNSSQQAVLIENTTAGGFVNMLGATITDTGGTGVQILNASGSATIDNLTSNGSTSNGILVSNSTGIYNFRDSVRASTNVAGATNEGVLISGLGATGQVTFEGLTVGNANNTGIRITNNSGRVTFLNDVTVNGNGGGIPPLMMMGGTPGASAFLVDGAQATSVVDLQSNLIVNATIGSGSGLSLMNNLAGSVFQVGGLVNINGSRGQGLTIDNEAGSVAFNGGFNIGTRLGGGISITNSTGSISFVGPASVDNLVPGDLDVNNEIAEGISTAVLIQDNEADIFFSSLTVNNARGVDVTNTPAGVSLINNMAGMTNGALIVFGELNVLSATANPDGDGLFGINNTSITIGGGTFDVTNGTAIDLEESGWSIALASLSSADSPDSAIRLVNANPPANNTFGVGVPAVAGTATVPGQGGTITNATGTSVFLSNAGQVAFQGLRVENGGSAFVVLNSNLAAGDSQLLDIRFSLIEDPVGNAIFAQNLSTLNIEDTQIDDILSARTIDLVYTEAPNDPATTEFAQFDNPYEVFIDQTIINALPLDIISVDTLAGGTGAHLDMVINNSVLNIVSGDVLLTNEDVIDVAWNGPSRMLFSANQIGMNGVATGNTQTAFRIRNDSTTDRMLLSIVDNQLIATDNTAVGIDLNSLGPADIVVENNLFTFAGTNAVGAEFTTSFDTNLFLTNNLFRFEGDGGSGFLFPQLNQPTALNINGNVVQLFDDGVGAETGFRATFTNGVINYAGTINNIVELINPDGLTAAIESTFIFPGLSSGSFVGNGALQP